MPSCYVVAVASKQRPLGFLSASHQMVRIFLFPSLVSALHAAPTAARVEGVPAFVQSSDSLEALAITAFKKFLEASANSLHNSLGLPLDGQERQQYIQEAVAEYLRFAGDITHEFKLPEAYPLDAGDTLLNSEYKTAISGLASREPRESSDPNGDGSQFFFRKAEELRIAQREWIGYRDTTAKWFHSLNPLIDEAAWKCLLSEKRAAQIHETELESEVKKRLTLNNVKPPGIEKLERPGSLLDDRQFLEAFAWIQQSFSTDYRSGLFAYAQFVATHWQRLEGCVKMEMSKSILEAYNASLKKQAGALLKRKRNLDREIKQFDEEGTIVSQMIGCGRYTDANHQIAGLQPWIKYSANRLRNELSVICEFSAAALKNQN